MHAFTLRFFRRKGFGRFLSDRCWGLGSFGNGEAKPEHVPDHMLDHMLDVAGTYNTRYYGGDDRSDGHMNYQRGTTLE